MCHLKYVAAIDSRDAHHGGAAASVAERSRHPTVLPWKAMPIFVRKMSLGIDHLEPRGRRRQRHASGVDPASDEAHRHVRQ